MAPSGRLYPCERVIGADADDNPLRLAGHVSAGNDFLGYRRAASKSAAECEECSLKTMCNTTCRCSNFIRTGHVDRPDGLLCLVNQCCVDETLRALGRRNVPLATTV